LTIWYQEAGGPKLPMKYGRVDVTGPEQCPPEGKLPGKKFEIRVHSTFQLVAFLYKYASLSLLSFVNMF
jgi:hypothetical protein